LTDEQEVVEQFRQYFIEACSPLTARGSANLENRYDYDLQETNLLWHAMV